MTLKKIILSMLLAPVAYALFLAIDVAEGVPSNQWVLAQLGLAFNQTAAEIGASVTPTNYGYPPGNVLRYGCDPSGVFDSSTCFTNALNSNNSVSVPPPNSGAKYIVHDVTIPSGVVLNAYGAYFTDKTGASYIFKLTGFGTSLLGAYISSATNCSIAAVVIDDGQKQLLRDVRIINSTTGVRLQSTSNGGNGFGNAKATIDNLQVENFSTVGFDMEPNVHDGSFLNVYVDANTISGSGGYKPKTGAIGFKLVGTGSTVAFGGNQFSNVLAINAQTAFQFTDANLDNFTNATADNCSGAAFVLGGSTNKMQFANVFAGACAIGIYSSGTGSVNRFTGILTNSIGVIPSGGGTDFYAAGGFGSFYDVLASSTGSVSIATDAWQAFGANAHTFNESTVGTIQLLGGRVLAFNSNGTVAANATVFIGLNGQNATEGNVQYVLPTDSTTIFNAARVIILNNVSPGAGQSFTYTLRNNSADTALTCSTSGSGVFQATCSGGPISLTAQHSIDLKLVTSATAGVAIHRGYILLLPQPN